MNPDIGQIVSPAMLLSVQDMLGQVLRTAGLIAVATLIIVQLIKVPTRLTFHYWMTKNWLARRTPKAKQFEIEKNEVPAWLAASSSDPSPPAPASEVAQASTATTATTDTVAESTSDDPFPAVIGWMPFVPLDFYLKKIQNVAQRALEHPVQNEVDFAYFAADAAVPDMVVTYQVDAIARRDPKFLERLTERSDGAPADPSSPKFDASVAAAVASAQDNVSTSIERSLDDLQIRLTFWWPIFMRFVVVIVAIAIGLGFLIYLAAGRGQLTLQSVLAMMVIGAAAGYIASFAYDLLALLAAFRPRAQ